MLLLTWINHPHFPLQWNFPSHFGRSMREAHESLMKTLFFSATTLSIVDADPRFSFWIWKYLP
jgi:hypothetical protein